MAASRFTKSPRPGAMRSLLPDHYEGQMPINLHDELRIEVALRQEFSARAEKAEAEVAKLRARLAAITSAIASANPDDTIGSIKVDIPKDGYQRQYLVNAVGVHEQKAREK